MPTAPPKIRVSSKPISGAKHVELRLQLRFKPEDLGPEKTEQLISGIVRCVYDVLDVQDQAELARQFKHQSANLRSVA